MGTVQDNETLFFEPHRCLRKDIPHSAVLWTKNQVREWQMRNTPRGPQRTSAEGRTTMRAAASKIPTQW